MEGNGSGLPERGVFRKRPFFECYSRQGEVGIEQENGRDFEDPVADLAEKQGTVPYIPRAFAEKYGKSPQAFRKAARSAGQNAENGGTV